MQFIIYIFHRTFCIADSKSICLKVMLEKGKNINIKTLALGDLDEKTGSREVFFEVNGFMRTIFIEDKAEASVSV